MKEILKAAFRADQLELAAAIGETDDSLESRITQLFKELDDPLLSGVDVCELLGNRDESIAVEEALAGLVASDLLEASEDTSRPLDEEGLRLYRLAGVPFSRLRLEAQEADLGDGQRRMVFSCDGRLVRAVARIDRLDAVAGTGNQRAEIVKHVQQIADGISNGNQVPNSILLVLLDGQVADDSDEDLPSSFIRITPLTEWVELQLPGEDGLVAQRVRTVEVDFPYRPSAFDEEKSALLVDGQQRTAALALVDVDKRPVCVLSVNAIVASEEDAKKVFGIANSTQKIQTQFSRALLASMDDAPGYLRSERAKAIACRLLALDDESSPFCGLVQYPGAKQKPRPPVVYNSLFQVVASFADSGLPIDREPMELAQAVSRSFSAVKQVWPDAWGRKPTESRLMHGVGLKAMAALLVNKVEQLWDLDDESLYAKILESLMRLKPKIVWTDEEAAGASTTTKKIWREEISGRQNTQQDIAALTSFLKKESLALDTAAKRRR